MSTDLARGRYDVTSPLIAWAYTQNDPLDDITYSVAAIY